MYIFPRRSTQCSFSRRKRRGIAAVEFAVCMPLVVMIVCASIEASSMVFLKLDLQTSAYEAARVAATPAGTATDAVNRGVEVLTQRKVCGGGVQINPNSIANVPVGGLITVTASAPVSSNRVIAGWFFGSGSLSAATVMVREGTAIH